MVMSELENFPNSDCILKTPIKSQNNSMNDVAMTSMEDNNTDVTGSPIISCTPYISVSTTNKGTPLKNDGVGTPVLGITTPCGSYVYNPFYKEFIKGLTSFTVSPGIFAPVTASSFHSQGHNKESGQENIPMTPEQNLQDGGSSKNSKFRWSPEIEGDLFPQDIDENPVSQFKLQKTLSSQHYSDFVQSQIDSFFQSQIVLPSPMTTSSQEVQPSEYYASHKQSPVQFSTSKMSKSKTDDHTPKGRTTKSKSSAIHVADVQLQTDISLPPGFDLLSLLKMQSNPSTTSITTHQESNMIRCLDKECNSNLPKCDECFVERSESYPHRGLFMCMSCREKTDLHSYSRRSLFVETLDVIADNSADFSASTDNLNLSNTNSMETSLRTRQQRDTLTDSTTLSNLSMRTATSQYKLLPTREVNSPKAEDCSLPIAESSVLDSYPCNEFEGGSPFLGRESPNFPQKHTFFQSPDISPIVSLDNSIEDENAELDLDESPDQNMTQSTKSFAHQNESIESL